ncbi:MAG: hypothetical protein GY817_08200 [bacterium]|nr:hypothetical protein [bacterium]
MKIYKLSIISLILFTGCNSYVIQNFIGTPTTHLDTYNKYYQTKTKIFDPDYLKKVRSYLYKNEADIYKQTETSLYVRNLQNIFQHALRTTSVKLDFSQKNGTINIISKNLELAEYLKDTLVQNITEQSIINIENENKDNNNAKKTQENSLDNINS